jgi:hypothetical protein
MFIYFFSIIGSDLAPDEREAFRDLFYSMIDKNQRMLAQVMVLTLTVFNDLKLDTYPIDQLVNVTGIMAGTLYNGACLQGRISNLNAIVLLSSQI